MPIGSPGFRQAIHEYLDRNLQILEQTGIDILLGLPCDAVMTPEPDAVPARHLMKSLDSSNAGHRWF